MPELKNSSRVAVKATYVTRPVATDPPDHAGDQAPSREPSIFAKAELVRGLAMTGEEARQLEKGLDGEARETLCKLVPLIDATTSAEHALHLSKYVAIPAARLISVAKALNVFRRSVQTAMSMGGRPTASQSKFFVPIDVQIRNLEEQAEMEPVGWLHLERLEMKPVGVERGELVSTIPMAPGEIVRVSYKEWSTHSEELDRIVTDELETYAERGVEEKHDVAMSSESEIKRDSTLNFGVSVSGGYGPVSMTASVSSTTSTSEREARKDSANHAQAITQKASTRSRKEQKISFRIESKAGDSSESARVIENKDNKAVRIDYYRMMRKWRVDLIRYDLRMTYDLVVPDPGFTLRQQISELSRLDDLIDQPFRFDFPIRAIDRNNWATQAELYGAAVAPPPPEQLPEDVNSPPLYQAFQPFGPTAGQGLDLPRADYTEFRTWEFPIRQDYLFRPVELEVNWMGHPGTNSFFDVIGDIPLPTSATNDPGNPGGWSGVYKSALEHLNGATENATIAFKFRNVHVIQMHLFYRLELKPDAWERWQTETWRKLRECAEQQHYTNLQRYREMRDRLAQLISQEDTLALRRAEHEEIMKRSLQWLIGPSFDLSPVVIENLLNAVETSASTKKFEERSSLNLTENEWSGVRRFGEFVKFIHHAVEWENVLYFLYPYFWGSSGLSEQRRTLHHPDPFRRQFLRAGAARVVLPVRPGFERRFASYLDTGVVPPNDGSIAGSSAYLSIADEMRAFARTNYPGIVPANPDDRARARTLTSPKQQRAWDDIQRIIKALEKFAENEKRKEPSYASWRGAPVEAKYYPSEPTWVASVLSVDSSCELNDPWGRSYRYSLDGTVAPFRVFTFGADGKEGGDAGDSDISTESQGNLIATWFEYTPTSGMDIQIDTPAAVIA